jgi:hypothetical protein
MEILMNSTFFRRGLALAFVLASSASIADTLPAVRSAEMAHPSSAAGARDDSMSRTEFMAMAGKVFDMAVQEGRARNGRVTATQLLEYRRALPTP